MTGVENKAATSCPIDEMWALSGSNSLGHQYRFMYALQVALPVDSGLSIKHATGEKKGLVL